MNIKIQLFLLKLREFYINNFFVKIECIYKDTDYYLIRDYLFINFLIRLIPFFLIKCFCNYYDYNIIYNIDDIYNITCKEKSVISPIIISCKAIGFSEEKDLTSNIKFYNALIPLYFFAHINKILHYNKINIKYMHNHKMISKEVFIDYKSLFSSINNIYKD